ncbi:MAG: MFS transporter [Alphaproteobacteria bacterium]
MSGDADGAARPAEAGPPADTQPGGPVVRPQPEGPPRRVIYVGLTAGLVTFAMGQSILFALLGPLARRMGLTELHVGALVSLTALVIALASPWWGRLGDRVGRRAVMVFGLVSYALTTLLFALAIMLGLSGDLPVAWAFAGMVGARVLYALLSAGIQPTAAAYVADTTTGPERTAGLALVSGAYGVGLVVGPVFGAGLSYFGLITPLFAVSGLALASALALVVLLPARSGPGSGLASDPGPFWSSRAAPHLLLMFGVMTVGSATQQTAAFYLQDLFNLDDARTVRAVGLIMAASALTMVLTQGLIVQWFRPRSSTLVRLGLICAAVTFAILLASHQFWGMVIGYSGLGLSMGLLYPGIMTAASFSVGERDQGAIAGLMGSATAAGVVVGPLMGTGLYRIHPDLPLLVSGVIVLGLLLTALEIHFFRPGLRPRFGPPRKRPGDPDQEAP